MDFQKIINEIIQLQNNVDDIYIYGAGFYGKDVYRALKRHNVSVTGFLVTDSITDELVFGLPVKLAKSILNKNVGIVLGLSDIYCNEVMNYLKSNNFNMDHVLNGGKYITKTGGRLDLRNSKVLEISTVMGCSVKCKFCPQDVLVKKYYETNKLRKKIMTIKDFEQILLHTPDDCIINFSGMAEPFLNKDCLDMVRMACDAKRRVYIFTTLTGADMNTTIELLKLPIYYMTLHVADRYGYAHIPITEEYYSKIEKVIMARKASGEPFVDFVNAQAEPDSRVDEICRGKYEIMYSVQDRAGNLQSNELEHREEILGAGDKIQCCFCGDDLSNNTVLPDGTLLICNMDYGMKHVLGNLYLDDYDSIRSKGELQRILAEMDGGTDMDLLCRYCLLARKRS